MCLEHKVTKILEWANQIAENNQISTLKVLIEFDNSYKQLQSIQKAMHSVESHKHY